MKKNLLLFIVISFLSSCSYPSYILSQAKKDWVQDIQPNVQAILHDDSISQEKAKASLFLEKSLVDVKYLEQYDSTKLSAMSIEQLKKEIVYVNQIWYNYRIQSWGLTTQGDAVQMNYLSTLHILNKLLEYKNNQLTKFTEEQKLLKLQSSWGLSEKQWKAARNKGFYVYRQTGSNIESTYYFEDYWQIQERIREKQEKKQRLIQSQKLYEKYSSSGFGEIISRHHISIGMFYVSIVYFLQVVQQ
jgi:hypothetical protein